MTRSEDIAAATQVRLYIYPDSGTANSYCTVDYASVVVGNLPMR